ncbi:MAG: SDR family oxidoreductase, partial [Dehalococcoidia bacterium]|nr:SDR family oxidoreductase [Dehalococcoidia bacterium]
AIIVIGSGTGRGGSTGNAVYGASKAGVDALAIMAAKYGEKVGVRVNCLDPGGMVDTYLFGPNKMPEFLKRISHLQPDVIVPAAVWLASDESRDVTGGFITATDFNANLADPRAAVRPKP